MVAPAREQIIAENPAIKVILERRSCRSFRSDPIPQEHLEMFIEAMRWAPSAGNRQPWRFHIITKKKMKEELAQAAFGQNFIIPAPVIFGVAAVPEESSARYGERGSRLYCIQDTAAAVENLMLAATALGYGSCWIGAFDDALVSRALSLPPDHVPVALVPVGRPARFGQRPGRKPIDEVVVRAKK